VHVDVSFPAKTPKGGGTSVSERTQRPCVAAENVAFLREFAITIGVKYFCIVAKRVVVILKMSSMPYVSHLLLLLLRMPSSRRRHDNL
jgi:hypothetical protein